MNTSTAPAFSLSSLLSRVQSVTVAAPAPVVVSMQRMQRKDAARNARTVASIIEESDPLDCHSFDMHDNRDSLAIAD